MKEPTSLVVRNAALDDSTLRGGSIVLRGAIDPTTLRFLLVDEYQREAAPLTSLEDLVTAFIKGQVIPDIVLGLRSSDFKSKGDVFTLDGDVYIIDGLQRVSAARHVVATIPDAEVRLGATIHFGTTPEWEAEQFKILNTKRKAVSPNVLLRNERANSPVIYTLFDLTTSPQFQQQFALNGRVSWKQNMQRGELITATMLLRTAARLHAHKGPGRTMGNVDAMTNALEKIVAAVGLSNFRANLTYFFDFLDACWGLRHIQYKETAVHMRLTFLLALTELLSDHTDFWQGADETRLFINSDLRKKFASFKMTDPHIAQLCGAAGTAREMLYVMLLNHINSGKRTNRLKARDYAHEAAILSSEAASSVSSAGGMKASAADSPGAAGLNT
jgi:hypothetical protein